MNTWAIYSAQGDFLRTLTCYNAVTRDMNMTAGEQAFADVAEPHRKRVVNGALVDLPPVVPTLAELKAARWLVVKAAREAAEAGGFTHGGATYDSDRASQTRIIGAVSMAQMALAQGQPFAITWTLADNSTAALDGAGMIGVGLALAAHVQACHTQGRARRAAIESATTPAEVAAVVW